jgi:CDP-glucose 4,6-dehydratase|tara:strand:- start:3634 stop:4695 length:1062 start_codon:yes stop_codon:yes gene_type:complete
MNKDFWKNKKVLITGDSGFKGAWLTLALHSVGAKIQGLSSSDLNNNTELFQALNIYKISNTLDIDIRDQHGVNKIFEQFEPEIVFHLAAQPLVRESYVDPVATYGVNLMGTLNILEAIRKSSSIKSATLVTTDKCYKNNEWEWGYRENDPLGGHDPYSSSKACAEILIQSYQKSFFCDLKNSPGISSVRAGNVIGGGDFSPDRLVPDLYRAITSKNKLLLRNPLATRPWQHVLEPIAGYIKVAEDLFKSGAVANNSWNFGPTLSDVRSVEEVSELFCSSWGVSNILDYDNSEQPHEASLLSLDISKAFFKLNWSPKWSLENAIERTAKWYQFFDEKKDILNLSYQQIDEYFSD